MKITRETVLDVEGMTCGSCVRQVESALGELDGVGQVQVRLREGKVMVEHDAEEAPVDTIIEVLRAAGYASAESP
jgi:copper chaperone